jgi:phage host-nuclease inhibitor protein Gam
MKLDEVVKQYIALRDKKAAIKEEYTAKVAHIDAILGKVENMLLGAYQELGVDSIKTPEGTAYISNRTSATVANWDSLFEWIRDNDAWEFLERRVSKTAVEEFKEKYKDIPPGVNYREEKTINVRRS